MTDQEGPQATSEDAHFETGTVRAGRAREQGLGLGERELAAQRDPGGVITPDVELGHEEEEAADGLADAVEESLGVQGARDDRQMTPGGGGGSAGG